MRVHPRFVAAALLLMAVVPATVMGDEPASVATAETMVETKAEKPPSPQELMTALQARMARKEAVFADLMSA